MHKTAKRIAVFIDNNSLFQAVAKLGIGDKFDYIRLKNWLLQQRNPELLRFYCGEVRSDPRRRKPFYEFLERAGYQVVAVFQARSRESNAAFDTLNCRKVHVEMAFDMCESILERKIADVVLVSGSSELAGVVSKMRERGINVEVVFFESACAPALRRGASSFRQLKLDGLIMGGGRSRYKPRVEVCCAKVTTESVQTVE